MESMRVSSKSRPSAVAGAIAGVIRDHQHAEVQAIGAGSVNQAIKAIVLAKEYLHEEDIHIAFTARLVDIDLGQEIGVKTAVKFTIKPRKEGYITPFQ